jgi:FtsP/CotA-like multicopper oxidase with cupredoxin domain
MLTGNIECTVGGQDIACKHITAGDGFAQMADRTAAEPSELFIFGFHDVTYLYPPGGVYDTKAEADAAVMADGLIAAETSAPTINAKETQVLYLTLTTAPMPIRPDLFDPHTVHFHGFANASTVFDGEPMASIAINQGASLTYYYKLTDREGTFLYHCHVEATEHMQMGMLGNLFIRAAKDTGVAPNRFAYNDTDNSTRFDVEFPISVISMDPRFHDANQNIQPLPFAAMLDTYPLFNGRGYPDTINPNFLPVPQQKIDERANRGFTTDPVTHSSQKLPSLIRLNRATEGEKILIRLSSVATVDLYTISAGGLPMQIIGKDSDIFTGRGNPAGIPLYQTVNSVNIGGGESYDIIIDTNGVAPGTYFLYSTNLNELTNELQDFGGMMTEIVIN